ncbi:hypothetical protein OSTOST_09101 [Ostertagia ostertagi]
MTIVLFILSLIIAVNGDLVNDTDISMQNNVLETPYPKAEMTLSLEEILKKLPKMERDDVDKRGYSIPEINERSGVDQQLFQGDILLTKYVLEDVAEGAGDEIEDATAGEISRTKRQAVRDHRLLWNGGVVNYYFDGSLSEDLQRIFQKAVDLWQKDSCVKFVYNSTESCDPTKKVSCDMGGFPNPRDCSKCVCPGGYGGDRCNERPKDNCGSTLTASPNWTTFTNTLGDLSVDVREDFTNCTFWIEVR